MVVARISHYKIAKCLAANAHTARVHKVEHKLYPKAIALFAEGRLKIKGRRVKILDKPASRPAAQENVPTGDTEKKSAENPQP